jgi:S-adenosylmethionine decarboxylase
MAAGRYHIVIDLKDISDERLNDSLGLERFLKELPGKIDMKILKGPEVIVGVPENPGITGFVIIDFSHISVHTFTNSKEALVDIFSCKAYDQEVALQYTLNYFQGEKDKAKIQIVSWE